MALSPTRWRAPASAALALTLAAAGASAAFGESGGTDATAQPRQQPSCAADGFCEDFETQTGTEPSGRWAFEAADCTGTGTVAVDSEVAHAGTKSIRVDGGAGYCNHAFVGTALDDVAVDSGLYVRLWVRHTTELPAQHVTFLAMEDANGPSPQNDLRMGGQNAALQWNRESDDATLPAQSPAGVELSAPLPVDEWSCLEYQLDPASGQLQTWLNGESVEGLIVDDTPTQDVDQQWMNGGAWNPSPVDLRLGWESYGEGADTLWFDDIAVATARVGC
ncbi:hydrolase [Streptomyces sp. 6N223]|uniref:hydrolase n=1 Tax=Streptomyces sp. 6N223 TaxID=3457412 RepID=UPI003FD5967E